MFFLFFGVFSPRKRKGSGQGHTARYTLYPFPESMVMVTHTITAMHDRPPPPSPPPAYTPTPTDIRGIKTTNPYPSFPCQHYLLPHLVNHKLLLTSSGSKGLLTNNSLRINNL